MRTTTVTYVCDRCKSMLTFDGEKMSAEFITQDLKKAGWRAIRIGSIVSSGSSPASTSRHLCSNCVKSLVEHLDNLVPLP